MKNIRFFLIAISTLFILSVNVATGQKKRLNLSKIEAYIEKARQEWEVPGMSFAIIKDDSVILSRGFGFREIDKPERVDEKTIFAIASNTKAFTSAALSILVDEGKMNWDDKVGKYLPYFKMYDPYVTSEMTIRDLLSHRSGLETFSGDLIWYNSNYSRKEIIEKVRFLRPKYGFRTHYGYSNILYLTAGEIVPVVTGKSWDDFIKERFLVPLGMKNTCTSIKDLKKEMNIAAPHHVVIGDTSIVLPYINWDNIAPAGSLNSNAIDIAQWIRMQLNSGKYKNRQILSEQGLWEMRTPHTILNLNMNAQKIWPSTHFSTYGLGWELFDYHGKKIVTHGGGADGMVSKVVLVTEENFGFVILTNSVNYLPEALMYYLLDSYFSDTQDDWSGIYLTFYKQNKERENLQLKREYEQRKNDTKSTLELKEYVGTYGGELYGNAEVKIENNHLVVKLVPTPKFIGDLSHWQYDTFTIKMRNSPSLPDGKVNFVIDAKGKVEEMRIDIPNPDFDFTELKFKKYYK